MTTRVHTVLVVPAPANQGGQCRIVARRGIVGMPVHDFRENPSGWSEVGAVDAQGVLRCEPLGDLLQQLKAWHPLTPGIAFRATEYLPGPVSAA